MPSLVSRGCAAHILSLLSLRRPHPPTRWCSTCSTTARDGGGSSSQQQEDQASTSSGPHACADDDASPVRTQLLQHALRHVKEHGWSHAALVAAARELHLSPAVTGILPRREAELVEHAIRGCNARLSEALASRSAELGSLPDTRRRLALALRLRLEMLQPHLDSWPQALAIATQPRNLPHSLALLSSLVDEVWHAAGGSVTDSGWHSQRALLAAVYGSTELYMLTDDSPGFQDTWQALDRRLCDMMAVSQAASGAQSAADGALKEAVAAAQQAAAGPQQQQQQQQQQG